MINSEPTQLVEQGKDSTQKDQAAHVNVYFSGNVHDNRVNIDQKTTMADVVKQVLSGAAKVTKAILAD